MAAVAVVMCCMAVVEAYVYTVGESYGWVVGPNYTAWGFSKSFKVGDYLVFDYSSEYSVDEVFENDYNTCNVDHPISSDKSGSTAFNLVAPGPRYFICGVSDLCKKGMKLVANVTT
ncbi:blue copper protein-like [Hibiscus syriacus]|nr:blue copper protein-like [Hibiscus syriacus]